MHQFLEIYWHKEQLACKGRPQCKKTFSFGHCPNKGGGAQGAKSGGEAVLLQFLDFTKDPATHSVTHRCMGKTCGFAAVLAATAATAAGPRGRNPISESTVKQSEK